MCLRVACTYLHSIAIALLTFPCFEKKVRGSGSGATQPAGQGGVGFYILGTGPGIGASPQSILGPGAGAGAGWAFTYWDARALNPPLSPWPYPRPLPCTVCMYVHCSLMNGVHVEIPWLTKCIKVRHIYYV